MRNEIFEHKASVYIWAFTITSQSSYTINEAL